METGTYEVEITGKYTARVIAEDHKGGFYIGEQKRNTENRV